MTVQIPDGTRSGAAFAQNPRHSQREAGSETAASTRFEKATSPAGVMQAPSSVPPVAKVGCADPLGWSPLASPSLSESCRRPAAAKAPRRQQPGVCTCFQSQESSAAKRGEGKAVWQHWQVQEDQERNKGKGGGEKDRGRFANGFWMLIQTGHAGWHETRAWQPGS